MRLLIVSGFLGSGKTTLVLGLAKRLADSGHRTCFIVNEVGEIGVDQQVLRDCGLDVWEITSGCVCCSLGADLIGTLQDISERFVPEVVVVELSGVALPANVMAGLASYRGRPFSSVRTVTLVDPTRLEVLLSVMTPLAEAQITQADEAVVTKRDEATADEIAAAAQAVARLNGAANLWQVNATDATSLQPLLAHLEGEEAWK